MSKVGNEGDPVGESVLDGERAKGIVIEAITHEFRMDNAFSDRDDLHDSSYHLYRGSGMVDLASSLSIIDGGEAEQLKRISKTFSQILDVAKSK